MRMKGKTALLLLLLVASLALTLLPVESISQVRVRPVPTTSGGNGFKAIIALALLFAACLGIWFATAHAMIASLVLVKNKTFTPDLHREEERAVFDSPAFLVTFPLAAVVIWLGWSDVIWPVVSFFADYWALTLILFFAGVFSLAKR